MPHIKTAGLTDRALLQASEVCTVHKSCHCAACNIFGLANMDFKSNTSSDVFALI